ncbi:hypothetical protein [Variovorax sp. YR216]|uniref:hypothetical protein n=1 Tax=Variovorax sp. YR216 TaxID=1882828 RepID=UPI00089B4F13|nr:hypothetical protein [Variovorax sp. YR216]SEA95541.1 hypothetical protein SAMN05444680_104550 [Variovorax sp. YR216]
MNLRLVLLLRGAISLLFVAYLLVVPMSAEAQQGLGRNGYFALVDGLIGAALWFTVSKYPPGRWLSSLVFADAVLRVVIGVFGLTNPGIQSRVLGSVAYFGVVIVFCIVLGAAGIIYALTKGRQPLPNGRRSGALPLFIVSLATLLFGLALILGLATEDSRRSLMVALTGVLGLTYLVTGLRLKR